MPGPNSPDSTEVVYVLGSPDGRTVKIGRTTNLSKRLADIQRMSPVQLTVLWTHPGGSALETNLHRHFKHLRSHGEWFVFQQPPVDAIQMAVATRPWLRTKRATAPRKPRRATEARVIDMRPATAPEVRAVQMGRISQARERILSELNSIADPLDRFRALERVQALLRPDFRRVQQTSVVNLRADRTWGEVGKLIGVSGARAEQISRMSR
ncbi:GIY-YIG nuclease family protein [Streptomyces rochei]|uniref:GIY-YIG nuclease family protein n=1 Tax=Streptomyces rochei TaxID=1928 RepID=UPI002ACE997F|nr:GIY-YIG nuclease family protein [Streptomyces rochei]WQC12595.1 GIY-YIG nuclease family protein [Streptomyces rochei]